MLQCLASYGVIMLVVSFPVSTYLRGQQLVILSQCESQQWEVFLM